MERRKTGISLRRLVAIPSINGYIFKCSNFRGEGEFLTQSLDLQITFPRDTGKIFENV